MEDKRSLCREERPRCGRGETAAASGKRARRPVARRPEVVVSGERAPAVFARWSQGCSRPFHFVILGKEKNPETIQKSADRIWMNNCGYIYSKELHTALKMNAVFQSHLENMHENHSLREEAPIPEGGGLPPGCTRPRPGCQPLSGRSAAGEGAAGARTRCRGQVPQQPHTGCDAFWRERPSQLAPVSVGREFWGVKDAPLAVRLCPDHT